MRIIITGGDGFIGRNLRLRLTEIGHADVLSVTRRTTGEELTAALGAADVVFHLAGVNRPTDVAEFQQVNAGFTEAVCSLLTESGRRVPVVYVSSMQAALDNPYGRSKRDGEEVIERYGAVTGSRVSVFRLPNVFGKWSRPNYNSAVATFCHNLARGLPITVHDPATPLRLVYIDDAVSAMIELLDDDGMQSERVGVEPVYATTLGEVVEVLKSFANSRKTLTITNVGAGLARALHATYLSYLPPDDFSYALPLHTDARGTFVEVLKTLDSGQFSVFTAPPGITRGGHYHHTKTEKFLVVKGRARFGFRHILTNETHEIAVDDSESRIVETVPGWAHDITNVGRSEMVVMVWASEVFDPSRPDTVATPVRA